MEKAKIKMSVPYFQVPNEIFDMTIMVQDTPKSIPREIRTSEKLIYIYLCRCCNQGSEAFPSYNRIAEKCGISRRKAIDGVKLLFDNGLLAKQIRPKSNKDNDTNIYEIILPSAMVAPGPSAMSAPPSAMSAPNKELLYKELDSEKEPNIYIILPNDEHFLDFYLKAHKYYLGKDHVRVTEEQLCYIERSIKELKDCDVDIETWREAVIDYFEKLPKGNNGNILAFLKASFRYFEVNLDSA